MKIRVALMALVGALGLAGCAAGAAGPPTVGTASAAVPTTAVARPVPIAKAAIPTPEAKSRPNPCAANSRAQLVRVSLRAQHLWMCAHRRLVYSTPITSGMLGEYTQTPTGTYAIQGVTRDTTLTLINGATYAVKYWIPFDGPLFGFHDSSWQDFPYGSARYRTDGSHGCVHMPLRAIAFLARWADVGATVVIRA